MHVFFILNLNPEKMSIHVHFVLDFYDVASNGHEKEVFTSQKMFGSVE